MKVGVEIERVWLLRGMPTIPREHEKWTVEQGYILAVSGESEGRVRRTIHGDGSVRFHFNRKSGAGLVRQESEAEIDAAEFEKRWPLTVGRRIAKTRYRVDVADRTWEIDTFSGFPLVLAEVELQQETEVAVIPTWLAPVIVREVTEDGRYRNFNLATAGPPRESVGG